MPYNAPLGGSPLGIIGVKSYYNLQTGQSTYNTDASRQFDVKGYNKNAENIFSAEGQNGNSIFSGYRRFFYKDTFLPASKDSSDSTDAAKKNGLYNITRKYHNDDIYDTSIQNIITKLAGTKAQLRPTDFAYLKNVGVYPNNRLMIIRRFAGPIDDNIFTPLKSDKNEGGGGLGPLSTVISWIPEEDDSFFEISFGEEWEEANADFTEVFNNIGQDLSMGFIGGANLGNLLANGMNSIPLPGFTEIFQRRFMKQLGIMTGDVEMIPSGNPNLIKTAKRRKTVKEGDHGSGLKTTVNFKVSTTYELKYISGVDPTLVWMDLILMLLRFGTSQSVSYGLSPGLQQKMQMMMSSPNAFLAWLVDALKNTVDKIITDIKDGIKNVVDAVSNQFELKRNISSKITGDEAEKSAKEAVSEKLSKAASAIGNFLNGIAINELLKYRVEIMGIMSSLTGMPSTPWHITIGNPLRPVFASGDMLVNDVNLKFSNELAFNDLPKRITVEFTVTNARPWGLQEIAAKFNSGSIRTANIPKSYFETMVSTNSSDDGSGKSDVTVDPFGYLSKSYSDMDNPNRTAKSAAEANATSETQTSNNDNSTQTTQNTNVNTTA